jgi:hypothetical protein
MVSSNAKETTVTFFLRSLKKRSPSINLKWIMSDKDRAQMNLIQSVYLSVTLLLCWWHVLHAWQQHFVMQHHLKLWELMKAWPQITNLERFEDQWQEIQKIAPQSVTEYLKREWLGNRKMWSAVEWKG